jgi:hypothetical protein
MRISRKLAPMFATYGCLMPTALWLYTPGGPATWREVWAPISEGGYKLVGGMYAPSSLGLWRCHVTLHKEPQPPEYRCCLRHGKQLGM